MCGRALSRRMSGQAMSNWVRFLCIFLQSFFHESTVIHSSDTSSTWNSICHDDSLVVISKDHHLLDLWLSSSKLFWPRGTCSSLPVGLWFLLQLKVSNQHFMSSDNSTQECLIFNVQFFFQQGCNVQVFEQSSSEVLYYGPLGTHHKLHSKHPGFLWDFCHVKFWS